MLRSRRTTELEAKVDRLEKRLDEAVRLLLALTETVRPDPGSVLRRRFDNILYRHVKDIGEDIDEAVREHLKPNVPTNWH